MIARFPRTLRLLPGLALAFSAVVSGPSLAFAALQPKPSAITASCTVSGTVVNGVCLPTGQVINFMVTDSSGTTGSVLGDTTDGAWSVSVPAAIVPTMYQFVSRTWGPNGTKYTVFASCTSNRSASGKGRRPRTKSGAFSVIVRVDVA
jgi:hypothetical protein